MRVLITRPEREAAALAQVLVARGHQVVIAPLFGLQVLHPPGDFAATLYHCLGVSPDALTGTQALVDQNGWLRARRHSAPSMANHKMGDSARHCMMK